jgi:hypothetical protein
MTPEQIKAISEFQIASDNLVRSTNTLEELGLIDAPVREFLLRGHTAAAKQINSYICKQSK